MKSKWMCISHHLPKYVFNRFQQCEISGGLSQISGIRSIKRRFGKSLRVLECLRRHRVDPGLSLCLCNQDFIRAINMDIHGPQPVSTGKKILSSEVRRVGWSYATCHKSYQNNKSCAMFINVSEMFRRQSGFASRPISKFRHNRNAGTARFEPTSLKVGIHSRRRWRYGATPRGRWKSCSLVAQRINSGSLGSTHGQR